MGIGDYIGRLRRLQVGLGVQVGIGDQVGLGGKA